MSLHKPATSGESEQPGPPSGADRRMAEFLGDRDRTRSARELLKEEGSDEADDLLGRLNAMDFIDQVIGDDYEMPSSIGDFEITGVLGRGGMGTVYQAYQESLDREVALKVLAPRFSSDLTMRTRFRKEAKATAAMHHRHIVPIFDYGEASGHMFFAMERVDGVSLDKHVSAAKRKKSVAMEPLDAARRFAGVADALALAHQRKILHRDVKPGNILVHTDGTLALADFGLSKFLGEASAHLTSVGGFLGTLHYAPPEQARGEQLGPASDLYSLGVTIFECITGKLPLDGDSTEAMLHALLNEEPPRLRAHLPKVPRDFEAVMERLLNKHPEERYQDGEALALDLLRVAEGEPVRVRRQSALIRLYRRAKRNPMVTTAVAVGLILLVVTVLFIKSLSDNRQLKGRDHLSNAVSKLSREPGPTLGPLGILTTLSGTVVPRELATQSPRSPFLTELDQAAKRLPEQAGMIQNYRESYEGSVLAGESAVSDGAAADSAAADSAAADSVVDLLRTGNGKGALVRLTTKIVELKARSHETRAKIDLYNLYLARALVYVSASVADPLKAARDLEIASFLRSGAFVPRLLRVFLESRDRPGELIDKLSEFVDPKQPLWRRTTAEFLLAFAAISTPEPAHLMRFSMKYETRKQLTELAMQWLGGGVIKVSSDDRGLAHRLASYATTLLNKSGNAVLVDASERAAHRVFETMLEASSQLQSWRYTFKLLGDEQAGVDALDQATRTRGAIHYVRLVQSVVPNLAHAERLLRDLRPKIEALLGARPSDPSVRELRARIDAWISPSAIADESIRGWMGLDESNPEAHLYAFCGRIRTLPKTEPAFTEAMKNAMLPAGNAFSLAADQGAMQGRLLRRLEYQEQMAPVAKKAQFQEMLRVLRSVGDDLP